MLLRRLEKQENGYGPEAGKRAADLGMIFGNPDCEPHLVVLQNFLIIFGKRLGGFWH